MLTGVACGLLFYWLMPTGEARLVTSLAFAVMAAIVALVVSGLLRRRVFVAVTRSQIVCYRVIRWRGQSWSVQESFRAPLSAVYINGYEQKRRRTWSVSFSVHQRGAPRKTPRFSVAPAWSGEFDEMLRASQGAGAELNRALSWRISRPKLAAPTD